MKKIRVFFVLYVLGLVVYGALTAEPEIIEELENQKVFIWLLGLLIFYIVLTLITNTFMVFVGSIFMKLANSQFYNKEKARVQVLKYMLVVYFVHLVVSYISYFLIDGKWSALVNIISLVYIGVDVYNKEEYKSCNKKLIVMFPFIVYILLDIALLMLS